MKLESQDPGQGQEAVAGGHLEVRPHLPCGDARLDPAINEIVFYDVEGFLNFKPVVAI